MKITKETLEFLHTLLPKGTKIVLDRMANDPCPIPSGTIGTVDHIDDAGQIHCRWKTGSSLAVIPGVDRFHVFTEKADSIDTKIYTHDTAAQIVELFDDVLCEHDIHVPSPEDDEQDPDDDEGLYGSTYSELLDDVENVLLETLEKHTGSATIVPYEFSGIF